MRSMIWSEKLLRSRLFYAKKNGIAEHEVTINISVALDDGQGDRLAIEMVQGVYTNIYEFNKTCDKELKRLRGGLYNLLVLPLKEAVDLSQALSEIIADIEQKVPPSKFEFPQKGNLYPSED
ncbi:MAG: hypothetical protein ACLFVP_08805 [Candidatus Bathyarchaeia archaeon]